MLRDTRLEKNLTVDEVSRATKIRPAQIENLENDDYSRFPNLAYARSFLFLYAKHLGVDISRYQTVEAGSAVGLGDYKYLQSEEAEKVRYGRPEPGEPPQKPRWLIAFFGFLIVLALGVLMGWGVMTILRVWPENQAKKDTEVLSLPTPVPVAMPTPSPTHSPTPEVVILPAQPVETLAEPTPVFSPVPEQEVRRAEPLTSGIIEPVVPAEPVTAPLATPAPSPAAVSGTVREIKLRVTKRTKVRIVRDNPNDSSVYYGFVNPAQPTLTFKGKYFWIKTADPDAMQITMDGQPVTGPQSGVEILRNPGL